MAYGSFAPVYTKIKRALLEDNDKVGYIVLDALAQFCDPFGWAYPGVQRLAELTRYAPSTIENKLIQFQQAGWIRIHETWNDRRRQMERDYQISPDVIWIQDEYISFAWEKWHNPAYILPSIEQAKYSLTKVVQPATEPNTVTSEKPAKGNQLKNHHHHQTEPLTESAAQKQHAAQNGNLENDGKTAKNGAKQPQGENSRKAKTETDDFPPSSAAPPQMRPLDEFQAPLVSPDAELLAEIIKSEFGTRTPQARQIVDCYGIIQTRAALEYVRQERRKRRPIKSPVGLMVFWLRNNAIAPDEALEVATNGIQDTSNPYAALTWADLAHDGENNDSAN